MCASSALRSFGATFWPRTAHRPGTTIVFGRLFLGVWHIWSEPTSSNEPPHPPPAPSPWIRRPVAASDPSDMAARTLIPFDKPIQTSFGQRMIETQANIAPKTDPTKTITTNTHIYIVYSIEDCIEQEPTNNNGHDGLNKVKQ